jgi:hypothetical protein
MRYTIDNHMNESLSFRTILTKVTFVMASVATLMLNSTCFVLGLTLDTFILAQVLVKCYFEAFVALSRSSRIFCQNRTPICQTGPSGFDRLALTLFLLDSQLYYGIFLCKQSTFSEEKIEALCNPKHIGRIHGVGSQMSWKHGFLKDSTSYKKRDRYMKTLEEKIEEKVNTLFENRFMTFI